jgi:RNA 2',3'-cyclic 3'-phosphodiesterase
MENHLQKSNHPIRTFIALELPATIRTGFGMIMEELTSAGLRSVHWVKPGNIHLTLKFLGDTPNNCVEPISNALRKLAGQYSSISAGVSGMGVFPNLNRPRVIWIGVQSAPDLNRLQISIENELSALGFEREQRAYSPHLTIGRLSDPVSPEQAAILGRYIRDKKDMDKTDVDLNKLCLIRSDLTHFGPVYTSLSVSMLGR